MLLGVTRSFEAPAFSAFHKGERVSPGSVVVDLPVPGALGGRPLTGGEPAMEVLMERALLCGEGAGVHRKDRALA